MYFTLADKNLLEERNFLAESVIGDYGELCYLLSLFMKMIKILCIRYCTFKFIFESTFCKCLFYYN